MQNVADDLLTIVQQAIPLLLAVSAEQASYKPSSEKWSKKEILGHLIDSACNNQQKFVRTMAQEHLDFVGYKQNFWVSAQQYNKAEWNSLVTFWKEYNHHIAHIIAFVDPGVLSHTISIEGTGPFTLEFIMKDYVEHLKHHLKQILPEGDWKSGFINVYNA
ncbi:MULTISPECIES: DinB family protein [Xanthocytophaga]|uniref:DinB family protein n=2 Tax=Xanthocytophaga TaxID=3078918 RepID=A0AAE3QUL4_9BACT|nr:MULTISPECIES: DinB family protein [Xanthocytophaga]MDJ1483054.1 DinB family protein [Xanthocytophaga flavus]MDJ1503690.1 DinB family protein [Xanthocytophaga agilis]